MTWVKPIHAALNSFRFGALRYVGGVNVVQGRSPAYGILTVSLPSAMAL